MYRETIERIIVIADYTVRWTKDDVRLKFMVYDDPNKTSFEYNEEMMEGSIEYKDGSLRVWQDNNEVIELPNKDSILNFSKLLIGLYDLKDFSKDIPSGWDSLDD